MAEAVLCDTDVLIDFLRGKPKAVAHLQGLANVAFSAVTVAEINAGVRDSNEQQVVDRLFQSAPIYPVTGTVGRLAGTLVRRYRAACGLELPDALIAATCMEHGLQLHTLNTRHYPMFKGLKPPYRKPR